MHDVGLVFRGLGLDFGTLSLGVLLQVRELSSAVSSYVL